MRKHIERKCGPKEKDLIIREHQLLCSEFWTLDRSLCLRLLREVEFRVFLLIEEAAIETTLNKSDVSRECIAEYFLSLLEKASRDVSISNKDIGQWRHRFSLVRSFNERNEKLMESRMRKRKERTASKL